MNTEHTKADLKTHSINLSNRKEMRIDGVEEVISFDEQMISLNTLCGALSIEGNGLHIQTLNLEQGIVLLDGKIDAVVYTDKEQDTNGGKSGFFKRLLR